METASHQLSVPHEHDRRKPMTENDKADGDDAEEIRVAVAIGRSLHHDVSSCVEERQRSARPLHAEDQGKDDEQDRLRPRIR